MSIYVLTGLGTSDGWGKPLGVFSKKVKIKAWIKADMFKTFNTKEDTIEFKTEYVEEDNSTSIRAISRTSTEHGGFVRDYCVFTFENIDPAGECGKNNFFDN